MSRIFRDYSDWSSRLTLKDDLGTLVPVRAECAPLNTVLEQLDALREREVLLVDPYTAHQLTEVASVEVSECFVDCRTSGAYLWTKAVRLA